MVWGSSFPKIIDKKKRRGKWSSFFYFNNNTRKLKKNEKKFKVRFDVGDKSYVITVKLKASDEKVVLDKVIDVDCMNCSCEEAKKINW